MTKAAVEVTGLTKDYGALRAVDLLDLTIREREVFALVGPNGAGKTTVVEILEGFRRRSAGSVSVLGVDPEVGGRGYRERIGIVLQEAGFEEEFSVAELVRLHAGYYPAPRPAAEVIEMVGLAEKRDARVKTLSGGQRRRLDLALGIVGNPELLFLDEPTTGFDPSARRRAWDLIDGLRDLGTTILLTTHYMEEAQQLADRVAVIDRGRLVALGTPDELAAERGARTVVTFRLPPGVEIADLPAVAGDVRANGVGVDIETTDPTGDLHVLTGWALERQVSLAGLTLTRPSLEDIYLELTEREDVADA